MPMRSIQKQVHTELVINKSTFINSTYPITSVEETQLYLNEVKTAYPDANHHCYAYLLGDNQEIQKYSDDGEPAKTAGAPMLEVLKKNDITNVISITTRYFGGIKLGAGGLVRAYTKSVSESVKKMTFTSKVEKLEMKISIAFDLIGKVEKYVRDTVQVLDTTYDTAVHYHINLYKEQEENVRNHLQESTNGNITFEVLRKYEEYE